MTFLKGIVEGNLEQVKQQLIDPDKIYIIKDLPENSISNSIMNEALLDNSLSAFLRANNTYVCIDDGTYIKGHTYVWLGDSWQDITIEQPTVERLI